MYCASPNVETWLRAWYPSKGVGRGEDKRALAPPDFKI